MYSDAGAATCAGYPGSRGFEEVDAQDFTSWGIDYLKYVPADVWPMSASRQTLCMKVMVGAGTCLLMPLLCELRIQAGTDVCFQLRLGMRCCHVLSEGLRAWTCYQSRGCISGCSSSHVCI